MSEQRRQHNKANLQSIICHIEATDDFLNQMKFKIFNFIMASINRITTSPAALEIT